MCECFTCGRVAWCGNYNCTNDECPECEALRQETEAAAAKADPEPEPQCLTADGQGRR